MTTNDFWDYEVADLYAELRKTRDEATRQAIRDELSRKGEPDYNDAPPSAYI